MLTIRAPQNAAPVGSIMMYAGNSPPSGWFECDGSLQVTATYPLLAAVCSTTFGPGDGTHFNLPQLQGNFVRGWAHTETTNDNARAFGSWQYDTITNHTHLMFNTDSLDGNTTGIPTANNSSGVQMHNNSNANEYKITGSSTTPTISLTGRTGDTETRPRNVALMYIIKHD